tara:strand:+ start:981 stop:1703 length:723 start_codon:yes stop_codon:yes gene_type:complete
MGYFKELPDLLYQSPLLHKNSSQDYIAVKNLFRGSKLFEFVEKDITFFNKYIINDGDRPDTIAEELYDDSELDYVVIIVAGITNINHQWPLRDNQIYDYSLSKYGTEAKMFEAHHYETFEIRDSSNRQILAPNLIVDENFKLDGSALRFPTNRYNLISEAGNRQLDDKNEYSVATDNIARAVSNYEFEIGLNEDKREINVLPKAFLQTFINDMRDVLKYEKGSSYITSTLAQTENTNIIP